MKLKNILKFLDYDPIERQTKVCGLISVTEYFQNNYRKIRHHALEIYDQQHELLFSYENIIHAYGTMWKIEYQEHEYIFTEINLVDVFCRPENIENKEEQLIWIGCDNISQYSDRILIADDGYKQQNVTAARDFRSWTGEVCITIE